MANPTGKGGFQKGQSGNPGGRPKVVDEVRALFQEYSKKAAEGLYAIASDDDAPNHHKLRVHTRADYNTRFISAIDLPLN